MGSFPDTSNVTSIMIAFDKRILIFERTETGGQKRNIQGKIAAYDYSQNGYAQEEKILKRYTRDAGNKVLVLRRQICQEPKRIWEILEWSTTDAKTPFVSNLRKNKPRVSNNQMEISRDSSFESPIFHKMI